MAVRVFSTAPFANRGPEARGSVLDTGNAQDRLEKGTGKEECEGRATCPHPFTFMALLATAATLVLYVICALAALRLMRRGDIPHSAALTATGIIGALYGLGTLYGADAEVLGQGAALIASGIPVYFLMRRGGSSLAPAAAQAAPPE